MTLPLFPEPLETIASPCTWPKGAPKCQRGRAICEPWEVDPDGDSRGRWIRCQTCPQFWRESECFATIAKMRKTPVAGR